MLNLTEWFPFDGSLENLANGQGTIVNASPVYTVGKTFSKALSIMDKGTTSYMSSHVSSDKETIMCWFNVQFDSLKSDSDYNRMTIITVGDSNEGICVFADKGSVLTLEVRTEKKVYKYCSTSYKINAWNHVAISINKTTHTYQLYLNGKLINSISTPKYNYSFINKDSYGIGMNGQSSTSYPIQGYITDYRVYTGILNEYEIRNISLGLRLYYKCNHGSMNLLKKTANIKQTSDGTTTFDIDDDIKTGLSNYVGSSITLSYDYLIRNISQTKSPSIKFTLGSMSFNWNLEQDYNGFGRKSITMVVPSKIKNPSNASLVINLGASILEISKIKLEIGTASTGYTYNKNDDAFKSLGNDSEPDSSGHFDQGNFVKEIPDCLSDGSPVFSSYFKFNGNTDNVIVSRYKHFIYDDFTYTFWFAPGKNTSDVPNQYIFTEGRADCCSGYGFGASVTEESLTCVFGDKSLTVGNLEVDKWYNATVTVDENYLMTLYLNGNYVDSITVTALPNYENDIGLCIGAFGYSGGYIYPFYGKLADFRLYNTCLSKKDVYNYANFGMSLDSNKNIMCKELVEY